ncbi:HI0074 family nucleotidyltransferase substrate-binding subunit [Kingella kingae]|uniref:HI0074 family nucleotidyltransferase substrate-binding subunit n=1 Tax=Kingella kingae TaxID=504 RepID=UPI001F49ACC7|nr:HI0074 family nucleotidyltransferase substrate-binding subunit [Kingella kingae]
MQDTSDTQIRDGLIQRFEFTYEISHKILKRYLENTSADPTQFDLMSFQDIIRTANEQNLLLGNWADWKQYRDMRARTSHTYDEETAIAVVQGIEKFLAEAQFFSIKITRKIMPVELNISPDEWQIVQTILQQHIPQRTVWAFGSRVNGKAKPYSDLDLAVLSDTPLSLAEHADLVDAFSESDLPWKVDLVDWCLIGDEFRAIVAARYFVVQAA